MVEYLQVIPLEEYQEGINEMVEYLQVIPLEEYQEGINQMVEYLQVIESRCMTRKQSRGICFPFQNITISLLVISVK